MTDQPFVKLQGMELEYLSGVFEEFPLERAIGYTMKFELVLDFVHFKHMSEVYCPGYLDEASNAIRPEMEGLGYHIIYNDIGGAPGKIINNAMLFALFTDPRWYLDEWINGEMERRFSKPQFEIVGNQLFVTARQIYRWEDPSRQITISDLKIIPFHWALTLIQQINKTPASIVTLMYTEAEPVEVEGVMVLKGARYINGRTLSFGPITAEQVQTAG